MSQSSLKTTPPAQQHSEDGDILLQQRSVSRVEEVDLDNPGFGDIFSDHMFSLEYRDGQWQNARIMPFENLTFSPAMATIHYGQTIFEGMKAFRGENDTIQIFRVKEHLERLNRSCRRMCIPEVDVELLGKALKKLITVDGDWVPKKYGNALYIRPVVFATDACLGVKPSQTYRLLILTSPVGAYYKEGFNPVKLTTTDEYIRAVKGGSGFIKTACNYGPTLLPAQKAKEAGYTQIIWLDAKEHRYIEEVGTMNIFFKIDGELHTPALNGSILGGITRDSVITLAGDWDIPVHERAIEIDEIFEAYRTGTLEEIFGTGTAAVISPVGSIHHEGETIMTDEDQIGPFARKLFDTITGIQYSKKEDVHLWMSTIS